MVSLQRFLIATLFACTVFGLAGCGSGGGNEGTEGADLTGASSKPAPPPPGRPAGVGSGPQTSR